MIGNSQSKEIKNATGCINEPIIVGKYNELRFLDKVENSY